MHSDKQGNVSKEFTASMFRTDEYVNESPRRGLYMSFQVLTYMTMKISHRIVWLVGEVSSNFCVISATDPHGR
jgi:hypothetical protein